MAENNSVPANLEMADIHKAIAIEIMEEMQRGKDVSTVMNRENILNLINKIKEQDSAYYLCHLDLNGTNQDKVNHFTENQEMLFKVLVKELKDKINFDVEFYKIGQSCNGLRKRFAIVMRGGFFSSKEPIARFNREKAKDKTRYLIGSIVYLETIDAWRNNKDKNKGEWSNQAKPWRIRINFKDPQLKGQYRSFFMYFETEEKMKEVEEMLFGLRCGDDKKVSIVSNLQQIQKLIEGSYLFYGVLKMMSVKAQVKKRKVMLKTLKDYSNKQYDAMVNFGSNLFRSTMIKNYKEKKGMFRKDKLFYLKDIINPQQNSSAILKSRGAKNKGKKVNKNDYDCTSGYNYSCYNPMITSVSTMDREESTLSNLTEMQNNLRVLKGGFQKVLQKKPESSKQSCFYVDDGVILRNYGYKVGDDAIPRRKGERIITFPEEDEIKNANYISLNKDKTVIIFCRQNDLGSQQEPPAINAKHIYDISNVVLDSNISASGYEENRLTIFGPKIDAKKTFIYKYKNDPKKYIDPDNSGLRFNNTQPAIRERNLICLQIFQLVYEMPSHQIQQYIAMNSGQSVHVSPTQPENDLYFFLSLHLAENKVKKTKMKKAKKYSNNHFIIEFNTQFFFDEVEISNNQSVFIQVNMVPEGCLDPNADELTMNLVADYVKPIDLGWAELTRAKIASNVNEYLISLNGIQCSDTTRLLIQTIPEITIHPPTLEFFGKDYTIGNDMYLVQNIDKAFFDEGMNNPTLSKDIKDKYYDVQFSDNGEFLFRPCENMSTEDFIKEFEPLVSPKYLKKILYNKRFKFLPQCEKFVDRKTLETSKNLRALPPEEQRILNMMKEGEWIYKAEKLNMRILSRNLGVTEEREITQLNYFAGIRQLQHYNNLNNITEFCPITENTFNVLDMNDLDASEMQNWDNFQWTMSIKFRDAIQMRTFVKALQNLRQRANLKINLFQRNKEPILDYPKTIQQIMYSLKKDISNVKLTVDIVEFRQNHTIPEDSQLVIKINKSKGDNINKGGKSLLENFELDYFNFKNSLLQEPDVAKALEDIKKMHMDSIDFPFQPVVNKDKFNSGMKILRVGRKMGTEFECKRNLDRNYEILISLIGLKNKKQKNFVAELNLEDVILSNGADIINVPFFEVDNKNRRIQGILHLKVWSVDKKNRSLTFEESFLQANLEFINYFQYKDIDGIPISKGRYEPNIYRRKILKSIRNKFKLGIDEVLYEIKNGNEILKKQFYDFLEKKCLCHPSLNELETMNPTDIILNLSSYLESNSYTKKMKLKFLKTKKRKDFFTYFSRSEWSFFFQKLNKNQEIEQNRDDMFYLFPKNKKDLFKNNETIEELKAMIHLGLPSKQSRGTTWEYLLNIEELYQITKEKLSKEKDITFSSKEEIFDFYKMEIQNQNSTNIIFSLIDNDTNYIQPLHGEGDGYEYMESIKTIAKAFFLWTELDIRLSTTKQNTKYVYFVGILTLIQRLNHYFNSNAITFWFIIGLAQYIELFQQVNPIFNGDMSHMSINVYVLVTKLILEQHLKAIYNKFLSLNYPLEQFISKQLNSLYSDYFNTDLLLRVFDILIFESSFGELFGDNLRYLRILCAIPITLFKMNEKKIIEAQSVSELETIFDDFVTKTYTNTRFIGELQENVDKFYSVNSKFEQYLRLNPDIKWDDKREDMQNLIYKHFYPVQSESTKYFEKIPEKKSILGESKNFVENYFQGLANKLDNIRRLYGFGTPSSIGVPGLKSSGVCIHINRIASNTLNNPLQSSMIIRVIFSDKVFEWDKDSPVSNIQKTLLYDQATNEIMNSNDLIIENEFEYVVPKYVNFLLMTDISQPIGVFSFDISKSEILKIEKVCLETRDKYLVKLMMEISFIKYTYQSVSSDDLALFNVIFASPEYKHNCDIENNLSSIIPNSSRSFANDIKKFIKKENDIKNLPLTKETSKLKEIQNVCELYKKNNIYDENLDGYTIQNDKIIKNDTKDEFAKKITSKVEDLLKSLTSEENIENLMSCLKGTNMSFEELLYCLVLNDKGSYTISEKMFLLFSIAQMKNKLLFNSDKVSIQKLKEMFYSLYKRYMIYFTKQEVDRMIDFALKDEKLFNIKYVLIYCETNRQKIDKIIFDNDRYSKNIQSVLQMGTQSEIPYDDVTSDFNAYINHFVNHYNLKSLNSDFIEYILTQIIQSSNKKKYQEQKCNTIQIVISKDNIQYSRIFKFSYEPNIKVEEIKKYPTQIIENNSDDVNGFYSCLKQESANLEISNTFAENIEISFSTFKKIFFTLPFISDLIRESCVFISEKRENIDKTFDLLKVSVQFNNENFANYYFPEISNSNLGNNSSNIPNIATNVSVKASMTIKDIRDKICENIRLSNRSSKQVNSNTPNNLETIVKYLANPELFECFIVNSREKIIEKILFYESIYSNLYAKNQNEVEIIFAFNSIEMSFNNDRRMYKKDSGFAKFYLVPSDNNKFEWRKCKITNDIEKEISYRSCDYPSKIRMNRKEYLIDTMGEGQSNFNI